MLGAPAATRKLQPSFRLIAATNRAAELPWQQAGSGAASPFGPTPPAVAPDTSSTRAL